KMKDIYILRATQGLDPAVDVSSYLWVRWTATKPCFDRIGFASTHGSWHEQKMSVPLVPSAQTCPDRRCYAIHFELPTGQLVGIVVSFKPHQRYTAAVQIVVQERRDYG